MTRRTAPFLAAVALLATALAPPAATAAPVTQFTDVPDTYPFVGAIAWMADEGITTGYDNGNGTFSFRPSDPVLREQISAFLYRYQWRNDGDQYPGPSGFTDVAENHRFKHHIQWMAAYGITTGYDNGNGTKSFRPSAPVLREQVAAFFYRYVGMSGYTPPATSPFVDVPTTHTFYREIAWAEHYGIARGYDNGNGTFSFRPSQPVLREQAAAFMFRMDQLFVS